MVSIGQDVNVVSGPHEGKSGRVVYMREVSLDSRSPEPYAVLEYRGTNAADQPYIDHISVPARRCTPKN